ncbi:unnamed protein product [Blepharisma stoltei]|uniref:Uncharacterized protein n=1 Tax=Blepharisma stoltei TaxID=1481888 RepID=A0AAU9I903_9CILI|nr:unnamed protein product [Blepharisma stoltei]
MEALDKRLSDLVIKYKFDFQKIARELGKSQDELRKRWTHIHCSRQNKLVPAKAEIKIPQNLIKSTIEEMTATELLSTNRENKNYLDTSNVDFTVQKSISITGEEITPSGFCILKHSLKDTFTKIRTRVKEFLPDMDFNEENLDEGVMHFQVSLGDGNFLFQAKGNEEEEEWKEVAPGVPIPNFDDIKVIPDEDVPKPKVNGKIEEIEIPKIEGVKKEKKMKEVWFKGRKTMVAYSSSEEEEENEEESEEESEEENEEEAYEAEEENDSDSF